MGSSGGNHSSSLAASYSGPSTAPAGWDSIICWRASELSLSGYAQTPYASSSTEPSTTHSHRSNELWHSSTYALPPYVSSSTPVNPPYNANNLGLAAGYALVDAVPPMPPPPYVSSSTAATPLNYANNLGQNSGYGRVASRPQPQRRSHRRSSGAGDGA